jgi:hypothetical protein
MEINDDVAQHAENPSLWLGMGIEKMEKGEELTK